jgi:hypothetical protein
MFMSTKLHEPSADMIALWQAHEEITIRQMFMSANTHEPSADMTALWQAQSRENSDLSDVLQCKHSMNHLMT